MNSMDTSKQQNQQVSILEFSHMSWQQIDQLPREHTVFFLPISPMEEHGPHLPVGTDFLIANDTAKDAIKELSKQSTGLTGVLLPAIPLGFCEFNTDFPGSVSVSSKVIQKVITSFGVSLASHGFRMMVICTYHMALSHLKGIYKAMQYLRKKYDLRVCEPWSPVFHTDTIKKQEPKLGFDTSKEVHAGFRETSLMKYQYPYLVDPSYKDLQSIYRNLNSPKMAYKTFKEMGLKNGYVGSPARADTSYGRWFYQLTVDTYVQAALDLHEGNKPMDLPMHIKSKMKALFWQ